ncbi:MAG TPA: ABC transporter ATP-binding protein [Longimicrobiales bacterium]
MAVTLLRAEGLVRRYGSRTVVDVDAFEVPDAGITAVLGPNGAGKSTLFRLLLLLEKPDAGRIYFDDRPVRRGGRAVRRRMAGVFQRPYLFAGTVEENVAFALGPRHGSARERDARVAELLDALGLTPMAALPVRALSGGESQRVALARALAPRPELLLLDEPTAALDVATRRRFREELAAMARTHAGTVLLFTQDPADAFALADRIAVMEAGRIVQTGPPEALVLEPATPFIAALTGAELRLEGVVRDREDGLLVVAVGPAETVVRTADRGDVSPGMRVHVAYRPEDLTLLPADAPIETSARNRFHLRVTAVGPSAGVVRVRLEGDVVLCAAVSRPSAEALGLAPGRTVVAQLKATAARVLRAAW